MRIRLCAIAVFFFLVRMGLPTDVPLAWDPSVSPNIVAYKVYFGTSSRNYGASITIGNQSTYTLTACKPGACFIAVTAIDVNGNESDFSNEVMTVISTGASSVTLNIIGGPAITQLIVTSIGTTAAQVSWVTNADCSGTILYGTDPSRWLAVVVNNLGTTDHMGIINGLSTRTHYLLKTQSKCGDKTIESEIRSFNTK